MKIWIKLKEMIKKMIGTKSIEQALKVTPAISNKMADAIELWTDMYEGNAPWIHEPNYSDPSKVVSLGLPAFIASEKARMAVLEMKSEISAPMEMVDVPNPDYISTPQKQLEPMIALLNNINTSPTKKQEVPVGDTARAEYLNKYYQRLLKHIRNQLEYAIAKGGLVIKPYVVKNKAIIDGIPQEVVDIEFDFIQADAFFPLSFNGSGDVTEAAFLQTKVDKDVTYRRLEHHILKNNTVTIKNTAFKSMSTDVRMDTHGEADLGTQVPLSTVPEWKDMPPKATIENVDRLLFAYFKMPEANTVDTHSPLGVSGYSRAVKLIKEADLQYSRLLWEYEGGELAIDIDRNAFNFLDNDDTGNPRSVMGHLQQRLYRQVDVDSSETYQPYSPALRDSSYINGLNTILMRIEDVCALSRGTLSDVAAEARTATELKILKQRSYSANADIQHSLEIALKDVVYIMNTYCTLYNAVEDVKMDATGNVMNSEAIGKYEISFEWDDSILVDVNEELGKRLQLMQSGLSSKLELRMWYFGETEAQAREKLNEVSMESQQAMQQNLMTQQAIFGGEQ